jgi:hypothetical protein
VQVTATSVSDSTKSATAQLTITSDIAIALSPTNANVELGATQAFHAAITSNGHPDTAVRWSLSGAGCPALCGSIDLNGNYTAPGVLPSPPAATVVAQSVADPSKQASATITTTSSFTLQITAPTSVPAGGIGTIVATMTPVPGSNPSTVLSWSLSGPGCSSTACGTLTVVTTQGAGGNVIQDTATYTAPNTAPNPDSVIVTVTPQADPTKKAQATMSVQPGVSMSLTPSTETLAINHRVTLTAQVFGTTNTTLSWSVSGVTGGSASVGQICVAGSRLYVHKKVFDQVIEGVDPPRRGPFRVVLVAIGPAESRERDGCQLRGQHKNSRRADHGHQPCARHGATTEREARTFGGAGIHRNCTRHKQSKRYLANSGQRLRQRGGLRRD